MSRISFALLAGALAFLVLPSSGTAQAPRRPPAAAPETPLRAALRAFNEGRYDEVDAATEKMDARDPSVVALKARAAIARGRYAAAEALLRPIASRAPQSEAALELGLLQHMLGRADAAAILDKVEALKSFQMALQVDARWTPALVGAAKALADDNPPQAASLAKRALEVNPSSVDAHLLLAGEAADATHPDEARQAIEKALAVNPSNLDALALRGALAYVADKPQEFEADVAKASAIAPRDTTAFLAASELAARNYRFDEAVTLTRRALALDGRSPRALADLGIQLLRTGDEPA